MLLVALAGGCNRKTIPTLLPLKDTIQVTTVVYTKGDSIFTEKTVVLPCVEDKKLIHEYNKAANLSNALVEEVKQLKDKIRNDDSRAKQRELKIINDYKKDSTQMANNLAKKINNNTVKTNKSDNKTQVKEARIENRNRWWLWLIIGIAIGFVMRTLKK